MMHAPSSPTLSTTSSTASTTATVIDSHPNPKSLINLGKQLKYLFIGLALALYFQVYQHLKDALTLGVFANGSAKLALLSVVLLVSTVVMFTYVILLPARGFAVNYVDWKRDPHLSTAIPLLTACIILGWSLLLITLSPIGAPAPPPTTLQQRLSQAASYTGFDSLESKIATLPYTTERWDKISSFLHLPSSSSSFHQYFTHLSQRADDWSSHNLKTIGWTGALLGSIGSYLAVFGSVGLIGFVAPDNRRDKTKTF